MVTIHHLHACTISRVIRVINHKLVHCACLCDLFYTKALYLVGASATVVFPNQTAYGQIFNAWYGCNSMRRHTRTHCHPRLNEYVLIFLFSSMPSNDRFWDYGVHSGLRQLQSLLYCQTDKKSNCSGYCSWAFTCLCDRSAVRWHKKAVAEPFSVPHVYILQSLCNCAFKANPLWFKDNNTGQSWPTCIMALHNLQWLTWEADLLMGLCY